MTDNTPDDFSPEPDDFEEQGQAFFEQMNLEFPQPEPSPQSHNLSAMMEAAVGLHELFLSFGKAGFTTEQAMRIVLEIVKSQMLPPSPGADS